MYNLDNRTWQPCLFLLCTPCSFTPPPPELQLPMTLYTFSNKCPLNIFSKRAGNLVCFIQLCFQCINLSNTK